MAKLELMSDSLTSRMRRLYTPSNAAMSGTTTRSRYRGRPRANVDALVDLAQRFGQLAVQLGARLPECEANPVMIAGDSVVVADARAVWQPQGEPAPSSKI